MKCSRLFSNVKFVIFLDRSRAQDERVPQGYDSGLCRWGIWFINDTPNHKPCVISWISSQQLLEAFENLQQFCVWRQFCFWHSWLRNVQEYCHMSSLQFSSIDELRIKMYPKVMIRVYVGKESDSSTCRPKQKACAILCTSSRQLLKTFETSQNYLFSRRYMWQKRLWSVPECLHMCLQCFSINELRLNLYPKSLWFGYMSLKNRKACAISWTSSQQLLEALNSNVLILKT